MVRLARADRTDSSASIRLEWMHFSRLLSAGSVIDSNRESSDQRTVTVKGGDLRSIAAAVVVLLRTLALVVGVDLSSVIDTVEALARGDTEPESSSKTSDSDMPETGKKRTRRQRKHQVAGKQSKIGNVDDSARAVRAAPDMPDITDKGPNDEKIPKEKEWPKLPTRNNDGQPSDRRKPAHPRMLAQDQAPWNQGRDRQRNRRPTQARNSQRSRPSYCDSTKCGARSCST